MSVNESNSTTFISTKSNEDVLNKIYGIDSSATILDEVEAESDDEVANLEFIVTNESNGIKLFLVISEESIREKNVMTAKRMNKWNIDMLESCERIKSDVIRIRFDTIKKDKKERTFQMETNECQELDEYLRNILSKRPLSEMNQVVFRCMGCAAHFSRERPFRNKTGKIHNSIFGREICLTFSLILFTDKVNCPECDCSYVVEIREQQPTTSQEQTTEELPKCESQASIGKMSFLSSNFNSLEF